MHRSEVPPALVDPTTWPGVDVSALSEERRAVFEQRERAVYAYLRGDHLAAIERGFGVNRSSLTRLLERCLTPHTDGRIQGLRALIPHTRAKTYRRSKRAARRLTRGGLSGALGQLFERLPELPRIIEREIAGTRVGLSANGRLYGLRDLQLKLMAACREAGLTAVDYLLSPTEN